MGGAVEAGNSERMTERRVKTLLYKRDGPTDGERERERERERRRRQAVDSCRFVACIHSTRRERTTQHTNAAMHVSTGQAAARGAAHTDESKTREKKKQDKEMPHTTALVYMSFPCLLLKRTPAFVSFHPISIYPRAPAEGTGTGTGSCSPANNSKG